MNSREAKEILFLYRPGTADSNDPEFSQAVDLAKSDPELAVWFEQHCAVQTAVLNGFAKIQPPAGLLEQILSERKTASLPAPANNHDVRREEVRGDDDSVNNHAPASTVSSRRGPAPRRAMLLAGSFATVLFVAGVLVLIQPSGSRDDFASFRRVMVGKVVRIGTYPHMDLETNNLSEIRQYLAQNGGQTGYKLPVGLEQTPGTGCASFRWHEKKVSMICFSSRGQPKDPDLFLFVIDKSALASTPPVPPEVTEAGGFSTASWTSGDKTYVLAAAGGRDFIRNHL